MINIESSYEEMAQDLEAFSKDKKQETTSTLKLPEEDITNFTLWLKEVVGGNAGKVTISKRLKDVPAIVYGQVSTQMRLMMKMAEERDPTTGFAQLQEMNRQNTFEVNASHPLIVKLNLLRKKNEKKAREMGKVLVD
mmetsp:Transcript_4050/g.2998  ORF Transcript_4050/g.2998 Transcript_4050/m.2998 type:complete len:137 (-) Transcript_4050:99-509(-)